MKNPPCKDCGKTMKIGGDKSTAYYYCHCQVKKKHIPIPNSKVSKKEFEYSVSEWLRIGKKRGYFKYYEDIFIKKLKQGKICTSCGKEKLDGRSEWGINCLETA